MCYWQQIQIPRIREQVTEPLSTASNVRSEFWGPLKHEGFKCHEGPGPLPHTADEGR